MILRDEIVPVGRFGKPHGINGEINLTTDIDIDLSSLSCIVLDVDGINVPFFFNSIRSRGNDSFLVMIDGVDSDVAVSQFVNDTVYALGREVEDVVGVDDGDGFYAEDLIGYHVDTVDGTLSGEIVDIDDATENVLFVVRVSDSGREVLVPVADEYITAVEPDRKILTLSIPEGLLEL